MESSSGVNSPAQWHHTITLQTAHITCTVTHTFQLFHAIYHLRVWNCSEMNAACDQLAASIGFDHTNQRKMHMMLPSIDAASRLHNCIKYLSGCPAWRDSCSALCTGAVCAWLARLRSCTNPSFDLHFPSASWVCAASRPPLQTSHLSCQVLRHAAAVVLPRCSSCSLSFAFQGSGCVAFRTECGLTAPKAHSFLQYMTSLSRQKSPQAQGSVSDEVCRGIAHHVTQHHSAYVMRFSQ